MELSSTRGNRECPLKNSGRVQAKMAGVDAVRLGSISADKIILLLYVCTRICMDFSMYVCIQGVSRL
jgi:hypothetical protein